jgi:hypothetical protein
MKEPSQRVLRLDAPTHAWGNPIQRVAAVRRLGEQALDLYWSTLPSGTTRARARLIMQRNARRGRRPSAVIDSLSR